MSVMTGECGSKCARRGCGFCIGPVHPTSVKRQLEASPQSTSSDVVPASLERMVDASFGSARLGSAMDFKDIERY